MKSNTLPCAAPDGATAKENSGWPVGKPTPAPSLGCSAVFLAVMLALPAQAQPIPLQPGDTVTACQAGPLPSTAGRWQLQAVPPMPYSEGGSSAAAFFMTDTATGRVWFMAIEGGRAQAWVPFPSPADSEPRLPPCPQPRAGR